VRIALIIGRGKPPLYFDTPTKNGEPQPEVIAAMDAFPFFSEHLAFK
jgi:hypothetical protein